MSEPTPTDDWPGSLVGTARTLRFPPDGHKVYVKVVDELRRLQTGSPEKLLCLHLLQFPDGSHQLRLAYYIRGKMPRVKGKWVWGQYATMLLPGDFIALYQQAAEKGWLTR